MIPNYRIANYREWYSDYYKFLSGTYEEKQVLAKTLKIYSFNEIQQTLERHCFDIRLMHINQIKYLKKLLDADLKNGDSTRLKLVEEYSNMTADEAINKLNNYIKIWKRVTAELAKEKEAEKKYMASYIAYIKETDGTYDLPPHKWKNKKLEREERERFRAEWARQHSNYNKALAIYNSQKDEYPLSVLYPPSKFVYRGQWGPIEIPYKPSYRLSNI